MEHDEHHFMRAPDRTTESRETQTAAVTADNVDDILTALGRLTGTL